ncbi:MAG: hypothetical protein HYX94_05110 [Chloroflexi bacterium]|nr:hypothetical protein [Chloroflexota bacterium]
MQSLDYLVIGHVAKDVKGEGFVAGGTVTYAAATAARLGRRVAMVTACGPGIDLQQAYPATPVSRAPSLTSTVFENVDRGGERVQHIRSRAAAIGLDHIPACWREIGLVHLAPLAREMAPDIAAAFKGSFIGLTLQGWLRAWDGAGRVSFELPAEMSNVLPGVSAVVFSDADVERRADVMEYLANLAPVAAVTLGSRGARIHWRGAWHDSPAFPAREVDPTGAGDVFAAAFFHCLEKTDDPIEAAAFANCAASFSVESAGTAGVPTLAMVERRLRGEQ